MEGEKDADPAPTTTHLGTVDVTPAATLLTASDSEFVLTLRSTSKEAVRYRVELSAPHLAIDSYRGEFTGSTLLTFKVNAAKLKGRDTPGTIKIRTNLGDVVVNAPIHAGLTGKYRGVLRYDGGIVNLGDAQIVADIIENNGQARIRFDPKQSLLFPMTATGAATGFGFYASGQPILLAANQVLEASFAGQHNHLKRSIGRRLKLKLEPADRGDLRGTFEESLFNVLQQPITLTGTIELHYLANTPPDEFELSAEAPLPQTQYVSHGLDVFGWDSGGCVKLLKTTCGESVQRDQRADIRLGCFSQIETLFAEPLKESMQAETKQFDTIAAACEQSIAAKTPEDLQRSNACGQMLPLACALRESTSTDSGMAAPLVYGAAFGRLMEEAVAAPLLLAQQHVVKALDDSFLPGGALAELRRYEAAMKVLDPTTTWMLQSSILEFMRAMDAKTAAGDLNGNDSYPAARSLAKLLTTLSAIEGERARVSAANLGVEQAQRIVDAQERAVARYLEAAALLAILQGWGDAPPSIAAQFTGALTPLNEGFAAALRGASAFGVVDGHVPFVFNPKESGARNATNFQQILGMAREAVNSYTQLQDSYELNKRAFEQNAYSLKLEMQQIQSSMDGRIHALCGASFELPEDASPNWDLCGANDQGEVGLLRFEINKAEAALRSALGRIQGEKDKLEIDVRVLADKQKVDKATLRFVQKTGEELEVLTWADAIIEAQKAVLHGLEQASITNFGASAGIGAMVGVLELQKGQLAVSRQRLETAQQMRFIKADAEKALIDGMGEVQKKTIDIAQLGVEMQQDVIGVYEARARALNAALEAKRIFEERERHIEAHKRNPANDPSFRVLRDTQALQLLDSRARAQTEMYLAGRALEYEINTPIPSLGGAVLNARNRGSMNQLLSCMQQVADKATQAFGVAQDYSTTLSVREMLGILGPRKDEVTGEEISEAEQFRRVLLRNANLDGRGGVSVLFSTNLRPGNLLWSSDLCSDRITTVQAMLFGDYQGNNEAQVNLSLSGAAVMRDCASEAFRTWSMGGTTYGETAPAVIQAGLNTFGTAQPNSSLHGQSVARATWKLTIPGRQDAPSNVDLDLMALEDIYLEIKHEARTRRESPQSVSLSCFAGVK